MENPLYDLIRRGVPEGVWLLHTVCFKFLAETSEETQCALMDECNNLYEACGGSSAGIVSIQTTRNVDPRKGYTWIEVAVFAGAEAFIRFHAHPAHKVFADKMAKTCDVWVVQDVPISPYVSLNVLS